MANLNFPTAASQKVANVWNTSHALADEGSYFIATNPTILTLIATTTSVVDAGNSGATSAQTRPVMLVYNPWPVTDPNAKSIYPKYLWMILGQVPTSAVTMDMSIWMEPQGANAYTSGGSTIVPVACNPGIGTVSRAKIYFGAITAAATTSGGSLVSRRRIDSLIPVTLDEWQFVFGDTQSPTNVLNSTAAVKRMTFGLPPLAIPPGYAMKIGFYAGSNAAAPTWEFEFGYVERPAGQ